MAAAHAIIRSGCRRFAATPRSVTKLIEYALKSKFLGLPYGAEKYIKFKHGENTLFTTVKFCFQLTTIRKAHFFQF